MMKLTTIFVGLAGVCFLGAMSLACGGSSSKSESDGGTSHEASEGDGNVPGLAAAAKTIGFPADCEACIGTNCASAFEACWPDSECMKTEICTGQCIEKDGGTPLSCSTVTCPSDGGAVMTLNECIVGFCANQCGGQ
jgi:hypothetical protein